MPALKNAKHELFCRYIVEGERADIAFEKSGYKPQKQNAYRLKKRPEVAARIAELMERGFKRHDITVDRIMEEYAKLGFSDIRQAFDDEGRLLLPQDMPDNFAGALTALEINTVEHGEGTVEHVAKFKLADKRSALDSMGKHLGMFKEDVTIKAEVVHKTVSELELARRLAFLLVKGADAVPD